MIGKKEGTSSVVPFFCEGKNSGVGPPKALQPFPKDNTAACILGKNGKYGHLVE